MSTARFNAKSKKEFSDLAPAEEGAQAAPETPPATQPSAEPQQPAVAPPVQQLVANHPPAKPPLTAPALPQGYVKKRGVRDRGQPLNVLIPSPLFDKLQQTARDLGVTQKDIVAKAIEKELKLIEFELGQPGG
jgi:hypothetical protein